PGMSVTTSTESMPNRSRRGSFLRVHDRPWFGESEAYIKCIQVLPLAVIHPSILKSFGPASRG
ncbi:MAG TPA: hypothetical protein VK524_19250, partial [Polyangiaceae bacterium]|nr:hypothetical protein [Polyangiaceae bacterium]